MNSVSEIMGKHFYRVFIRNLIWIVPINGFISVISIYMHPGRFKETVELFVGILNFPTIWFVVNYATAFLKSPNVNWAIASALLSLLGSLFWALVIALLKVAIAKKQSTEPFT